MSGSEFAKKVRPHKGGEAEERRLAEAAQRGPLRFADLYDNYFESVYAYVARRARDRAEVEDLTSEVFHKALANLPRFRWTGAPFAAWLFRIASNLIADRAKRVAKEGSVPLDDNLAAPAGERLQSSLEKVERQAHMFRMVGEPMPMTFMLYVEDADEWYARAMKAEGTISIGAPVDQPYGDRVGTVKDPFGNTWYISQHTAAKEQDSTLSGGTSMVPKLFRVALQVSDLDQAATFYSNLLDDSGTRIPRGSRHYFDCGPVILALVDVTAGGEQPQPNPDYIYFAVSNLAQVYERAKALNCLAKDRFHDQNAGEIVKRPWGELSFYVEDPWGNGLCFVDEGTLFTGR